MPKLNQKGFAPILLMLFLLGSVAAGTAMVNEQTNLFSKAKTSKNQKEASGSAENNATDSANPFPEAAKKCLSDSECPTGYTCTLKDLKPISAKANSRASEAAFRRDYGKCHKEKVASGSAEESTKSAIKKGGVKSQLEKAGKVIKENIEKVKEKITGKPEDKGQVGEQKQEDHGKPEEKPNKPQK